MGELRRRLGRQLKREDILDDAAKFKDSPFRRDIFKKTDSAAAILYRLGVANEMLRGIEVVEVIVLDDPDTSKKKKVQIGRPFIQHVPKHGYETMDNVLNDEELKRLALASIVEGLEAWERKLALFKSLRSKFRIFLKEARRLLDIQTKKAKKSKAKPKKTKRPKRQ
jgi:hypothetical protein